MFTFRHDGSMSTVAAGIAVAVAVFAAQASSAAAAGNDPAGAVELMLVDESVMDRIVVKRPLYDYAPSVVHDKDVYRLYWCAGVAGDFVLYAESTSPMGPWHGASNRQPNSTDVALRPTGSSADFDGLHTCDPNVIKVGRDYFMYYGGAASAGALTAIGVARSNDGVHFVRLNAGKPIVTAARTNPAYVGSRLTYGAGQPAVLYREPYFYLAFTDSTGSGANPGNGAGQFLLRSADPTFQSGAQEWTRNGWRDRAPGQHSAEFSFLESFGIDWMFDTKSERIIVASDRLAGKVTLFVVDPERFEVIGTGELPTQWREGPALIAQADKTTLPHERCDTIPIGVMVAEGPSQDPWTWDLALSMANFRMSRC